MTNTEKQVKGGRKLTAEQEQARDARRIKKGDRVRSVCNHISTYRVLSIGRKRARLSLEGAYFTCYCPTGLLRKIAEEQRIPIAPIVDALTRQFDCGKGAK